MLYNIDKNVNDTTYWNEIYTECLNDIKHKKRKYTYLKNNEIFLKALNNQNRKLLGKANLRNSQK